MKLLLIIYLLLVCNNYLISQELTNKIKFTNYNRANGLPEENVNSTTEDSRGYIWIGSNEGLFRFDGKNYRSWYANVNDSNSFKSNTITVIAEYLPNKILFSTAGELWEINIANFKIQKVKTFANKILYTYPSKLNSNFWITTTIDSIFVLNKNFVITKAFAKNKFFKGNATLKHLSLQYPFVFIESMDNQYLVLNYITNSFTQIFIQVPKLDPRSTTLSASIYDSTLHKLYFSSYFNGNFVANFTINQKNKTLQLTPILVQKDGALRQVLLEENQLQIQGGDNGLYLTDNKKFIQFENKNNTDNSIAASSIKQIYKSSSNDYWLSTTNGISKFNLANSKIKYWNIFETKNKVDDFKKIIKSNDNEFYFIGTASGLYKLNPLSNTVTLIKSSILYFWDVAKNGNDIEIVGGGKKHFSYNINSGINSINNSLQQYVEPNNDLITLAYKANNGNMWYSSNVGGGLVKYDNITNKYTHYSPLGSSPAFSHRYVHTVAEDSKGNLYFGSNKNHQILFWNNTLQKFEEFAVGELTEIYKHNTGINKLYCDTEDNLWIILDGAALLQYNFFTKKSAYININSGLPTDKVNGICTDNKNRIWISTPKGLCCYLPFDKRILSFTSNDGFPEDKFGEAIYFDKTKNSIYVCGSHTIASFNPDILLNSVTTTTLKVFIEDMFVNGKLYYFENENNIHLKATENNVSFNFSVADFYRNNQIEFEYKINNNNWISVGDKRTIAFNNLNSGKYIITVRCKYKGSQQWFETTYPFTFTIATPWNKSWWFYILLTLIIIGFAWWINRSYYLRKIEKQKAIVEKQQAVQEERNRIAADMHDDLGSGLTKITYLSQMALSSIDKEKNISKINQTSTELVENMSEIIWAMKEENNNLSDLILHIKNYVIEYCADNNLKCVINFPSNYTDRIVKGENRRHIYLAIKEIMHNIVKHSKANKVMINVLYTDQWIVTITDNGIGFAPNYHTNNGNGLRNISKRIKAVNGTVQFENNNGTSVILQIPL